MSLYTVEGAGSSCGPLSWPRFVWRGRPARVPAAERTMRIRRSHCGFPLGAFIVGCAYRPMNFNIVAVGEVLWDLFPEGPLLGGAPANFAYHAHGLGAQVQLITRVGSDELGLESLRRFRGMGLSDATVQVDETAPTGTVQVQLSGNGLAHFTIQENVAWDFIALTDRKS